MTKTLKQYLSLRGLLARRLREKRKEVRSVNKLLKQFPKIERMMAYCRDNPQVKNFLIYHQKSNSGVFTSFKVQFIGLQEKYVTKIEDLHSLNSASEQLKQLKSYD